jgi:hypothetical protein
VLVVVEMVAVAQGQVASTQVQAITQVQVKLLKLTVAQVLAIARGLSVADMLVVSQLFVARIFAISTFLVLNSSQDVQRLSCPINASTKRRVSIVFLIRQRDTSPLSVRHTAAVLSVRLVPTRVLLAPFTMSKAPAGRTCVVQVDSQALNITAGGCVCEIAVTQNRATQKW